MRIRPIRPAPRTRPQFFAGRSVIAVRASCPGWPKMLPLNFLSDQAAAVKRRRAHRLRPPRVQLSRDVGGRRQGGRLDLGLDAVELGLDVSRQRELSMAY